MDNALPVGQNVKRLISMLMAKEAIPDGGGFKDGIDFLLNPERVKASVIKAQQDAMQFIELIKSAKDNPYGDDDEQIAAAIIAEVEKKFNSIKSKTL